MPWLWLLVLPYGWESFPYLIGEKTPTFWLFLPLPSHQSVVTPGKCTFFASLYREPAHCPN